MLADGLFQKVPRPDIALALRHRRLHRGFRKTGLDHRFAR
jgi:hypothetical protein